MFSVLQCVVLAVHSLSLVPLHKGQTFQVLRGTAAAQESQDTRHGRGGLEVNPEGRVGIDGRKALQPMGKRMNDQKWNEDGVVSS